MNLNKEKLNELCEQKAFGDFSHCVNLLESSYITFSVVTCSYITAVSKQKSKEATS